jgi:hypothetical protein
MASLPTWRLPNAKLQAHLNVKPEQQLKIGELSARSGLSPFAMRFNEARPPSGRTLHAAPQSAGL